MSVNTYDMKKKTEDAANIHLSKKTPSLGMPNIANNPMVMRTDNEQVKKLQAFQNALKNPQGATDLINFAELDEKQINEIMVRCNEQQLYINIKTLEENGMVKPSTDPFPFDLGDEGEILKNEIFELQDESIKIRNQVYRLKNPITQEILNVKRSAEHLIRQTVDKRWTPEEVAAINEKSIKQGEELQKEIAGNKLQLEEALEKNKQQLKELEKRLGELNAAGKKKLDEAQLMQKERIEKRKNQLKKIINDDNPRELTNEMHLKLHDQNVCIVEFDNDLFQYAAKRGAVKTIRDLLSRPRLSLSVILGKDENGRTPFENAHKDAKELLEELPSHLKPSNEQEEKMKQEHLNNVKRYWRQKVDAANKLYKARIEAAKNEQYKANDETILYCLLAQERKEHTFRAMLRLGIEPTKIGPEGMPPIHYAAHNDDLKILYLLIDFAYQLKRSGNKRWFDVILIKDVAKRQAWELMDPETTRKDPKFKAAMKEANDDWLAFAKDADDAARRRSQLLSKETSENRRLGRPKSLKQASPNSSTAHAQAKSNADSNKSAQGASIRELSVAEELEDCAIKDDVEGLIALLRKSQLDCNLLLDEGKRIIHVAAAHGSVKVLNFLIKESLEKNRTDILLATDHQGRIPLDIAMQSKKDSSVACLKEPTAQAQKLKIEKDKKEKVEQDLKTQEASLRARKEMFSMYSTRDRDCLGIIRPEIDKIFDAESPKGKPSKKS